MRRTMRRLTTLVVLAAVGVAMLAGAAPAALAADEVLLAAEAEVVGPEPAPREADENRARELAGYEDREVPFTWGAAWILTFAGFVGLALMLVLYQRLVRAPGRQDASS